MDLKITKKKMFLTIHLAGDECLRGNIFLSFQSASHFGEELLIDFLNDRDPFFPLEIEDSAAIRLVHRKNILWVTTSGDENGENPGRKEAVMVVLVDGRRFFGHLVIEQPEYKSRVIDFVNTENRRFFPLTGKSELYYINLAQVSQVIPT